METHTHDILSNLSHSFELQPIGRKIISDARLVASDLIGITASTKKRHLLRDLLTETKALQERYKTQHSDASSATSQFVLPCLTLVPSCLQFACENSDFVASCSQIVELLRDLLAAESVVVEKSHTIFLADRKEKNPFSFTAGGAPHWNESIPSDHPPVLTTQPIALEEQLAHSQTLFDSSTPLHTAESDAYNFAHKLFRVLQSVMSSQQQQQIVKGLIDIIRSMDSAVATRSDADFNQWRSNVESVAELFVDKAALRKCTNNISASLQRLKEDPRAVQYFSEWKDYFLAVLQHQDFKKHKQFWDQAVDLFHRGRELAYELGWYDACHEAFDSLEAVVASFKDSNRTFWTLPGNVLSLALDTVLDKSGKIHLNSDFVNQARDILVQLVHRKLKHVSIPAIENYTVLPILGTVQYRLDGWVLDALDALPDTISIISTTVATCNLKAARLNQSHTVFSITMANIFTHIDGVNFSYRQLNAPHFSDSGSISLGFGGSGGKLTMLLRYSPESLFDLLELELHVDDLKLIIRDAKYSFLYNLLLPALFTGKSKRIIENVLQERVTEAIRETAKAVKSGVRAFRESKVLSTLEQELQHLVLANDKQQIGSPF